MKFVCILAVFLTVETGAQKLSDEENATMQADCGRKGIRLKVMFGKKTESSEAPWAVPVEVIKQDGVMHCSGTFVSPRHVITARHCFVNDFKDGGFNYVLDNRRIHQKACIGKDFLMPKNTFRAQIHFGTNCRNPKICDEADLAEHLVTRSPKKVFLPGICALQNDERHDDIAIIELDREVGFSEKIHPACLPVKDLSLENGAELVTFGFGMDPSDKQSPTGILRREVTTIKPCLQSDFMCAVSTNGDQLACRGDSGAGSLISIDNRITLAAVLSRGEICGTRLKFYADFLTPVRRYAREFCKYMGYCNLKPPKPKLLSASHFYSKEQPLIHNSGALKKEEFISFVFLVFSIVILYQFSLFSLLF